MEDVIVRKVCDNISAVDELPILPTKPTLIANPNVDNVFITPDT